MNELNTVISKMQRRTYIILCNSAAKLIDFPVLLPLLEVATDIGLAAVLFIYIEKKNNIYKMCLTINKCMKTKSNSKLLQNIENFKFLMFCIKSIFSNLMLLK